MKTVFRTMTNDREAIAKQRAFEKKTGVKWDHYHVGNGMKFLPILVRDVPASEFAGNQIFAWIPTTSSVTFLWLSEAIEMELTEVLKGAQHLIKAGRAFPEINRNGNIVGIYRRLT